MKYLSHTQTANQTYTVTLSIDMTQEFLQDVRAIDDEDTRNDIALALGKCLLDEVFPQIK